MRPVKITDEQIVSAGQLIADSGRMVTANSLRTLLGGGNPRRLASVWQRFVAIPVTDPADTSPASHSSCTQPPLSASAGAAPVIAHESALAQLNEQIEALTAQLATARTQIAEQKNALAQKDLIVDALSDELHRYKLRCATYEGQDRQQKDRIADLIARIDEQRSELNRGAQNRAALERALEKLGGDSPGSR
jgi:septal ring factor EnvC (AmiA/AmiB activator)